MLSSLRSFFSSRSTPVNNRRLPEDGDRFRDYERYLRAYRGYRSRITGQTVTEQSSSSLQRVRFNFNRPTVNLGAAFLAAKPLKWAVDEDDAATAAANQIWDRSHAERSFLSASRTCGIYGEVVGLATVDAEGRPRIQFVNPDICFPTFDGSDASRLVELEIAWEEEDRLGRRVQFREFYSEVGREVFVDGDEDPTQRQGWTKLPAVWIRNLSVKGLPYGLSDLEDVADLTDEYDHVCRKRGQTIDYHAQPTIVLKGVRAGDLDKNIQTMLFLPADGDASFLEWQGTPPDVEQHLTRVRNAIAEVSQVPAVAYGQQDSGLTSVSGVALRILYGPLLAKTDDKRANWGPELEYLMHLCLQTEGYAVPLEAVNAQWADPLPVDTQARAEEKKIEVDTGLKSKRTAMQEIGIENPEEEEQKIRLEGREGRLSSLSSMGASLPAAAELAGFSADEVRRLSRRDFVDEVEQ